MIFFVYIQIIQSVLDNYSYFFFYLKEKETFSEQKSAHSLRFVWLHFICIIN